jgi:GT2 family glycosyltransferase
MTDLSVVLISRNQEWNIARLLESVLEEVAEISSEVVLVDSASTDRTLEIARNYPIDIIRLDENQRLTAHKGQYVGYQHTSGDLILFLDGDMELCKGWLGKGLDVIKKDNDVAAVSGPWINLPLVLPQTPGSSQLPRDVSDRLALYQESDINWSHTPDKTQAVLMLGGAGLYRRKVLEQIGGPFNPEFFSDAEPELCIRIRHAGYQILRIEYPIAYHYTAPLEAISTMLGRRKRNLYLGYGQIMRHHFGTRLFWLYSRERGFAFFPILGITIGLICFLWYLLGGSWVCLGLWVLFLILFIVFDAIRKRSLYQTVYSLIKRLIIVEGTVRGFFKPVPNHISIKSDVIQRADHNTG